MSYLKSVNSKLVTFYLDDKAAVTVDFVVLTAGIVVFGAIATGVLLPKVTSAVTAISI